MDLPFSTRSRFFEPIERALREAHGSLDQPLRIVLEPGGYGRDGIVVIRSEDPHSFWTDWESRQPTRFSARVRAAATVLWRCGVYGRFRITHDDGVLTIQRV